MLRVLLIAAGFLTITIGLLLIQPGQPRPQSVPRLSPAAPETVTRAQTDLTQLSPATPDLAASTASVLAGLGATTTPTAVDPDQTMRSLTSDVLAGITAMRTPAHPADALQLLIVQSMSQGQSNAYIDALVNEAAISGQIAVPQALLTDTGTVDTTTLLASIVSKSNGAATTPPKPVLNTDAIQVQMVQSNGQIVKHQFYTVQSGDSLGSIAAKLFGDAAHFAIIFDANRQTLATPDQIRVGQRLTIPII